MLFFCAFMNKLPFTFRLGERDREVERERKKESNAPWFCFTFSFLYFMFTMPWYLSTCLQIIRNLFEFPELRINSFSCSRCLKCFSTSFFFEACSRKCAYVLKAKHFSCHHILPPHNKHFIWILCALLIWVLGRIWKCTHF